MADPAKPGGRRRGALVPATIGVKRRISRAQLAQLRNPVIRKGSHEGVVDAALIRAQEADRRPLRFEDGRADDQGPASC